MRYVFFQAHPDDLELNCAHLMHHLAKRGHRIRIASVTKGEWGLAGAQYDRFKGSPLAAVRTRELAQAASIHGISPENIDFLGYVDGFVRLTPGFVSHVISYLREVRPDVVVAPEPFYTWYYHMDHVNTGRALFHVMKNRLIDFAPSLYFYTSLAPNCSFPVSKEQLHLTDHLIRCHRTQWWLLKWMRHIVIPTEWLAGLSLPGWTYAEPYRRVFFDESEGSHTRVGPAKCHLIQMIRRINAFDAQYPEIVRQELSTNPSLYIDACNLEYWSQRLSGSRQGNGAVRIPEEHLR